MAQQSSVTGEYAAVLLPQLDLHVPAAPAQAAFPSTGLLGSFAVRLMIVAIGVFIAGMTVAVAQARSTPSDLTTQLNELLMPPADCSMPCWHGIQPGVTTVDEAAAILRADRAVADVHVNPSMISWWWAEGHSDVYSDGGRAFDGRMETALINGAQRVTSIVLATTLEQGQIRLALGEPDEVTVIAVRGQNGSQMPGVVHQAHYAGLSAFSLLECPLTVEDFWRAPVFVTFGSANLGLRGDTFESPALPEWFFRSDAPLCS
jgi:hypothetical protein